MNRTIVLLLLGGLFGASSYAQQLAPGQRALETDARMAQQTEAVQTTADGLTLPGSRLQPTTEGLQTQHSDLMRSRTLKKAPRRAQQKAVVPTWTCDFETDDSFDQFTVIDVNGDAQPSAYDYVFGSWARMHFTTRPSNYGASYAYGRTRLDADDWLITPGLNLKKGTTYTLRFKESVTRMFGSKEKMSIMMGEAATVAAMTETLMDETEYINTAFEEQTISVTPTKDGIYYIGFHCTSAKSQMQLRLDDIAVEYNAPDAAPAAIDEFTIEPAADASLFATLKFTVPTKTVGGDELTSVSGVRIYSNGEELADLRRAQPGQTLTYSDNDVAEAGLNTYTLVVYNEAGDGPAVTKELWIGLDVPSDPSDPTLVDNIQNVTMTWGASEAKHGGVFDASQVIYNIALPQYDSSTDSYTVGSIIGQLKGETTAVFNLNTDEDAGTTSGQSWLFLAMNAQNDAGASDWWMTNDLLVGKPHTLPFVQSFANRSIGNQFWTTSVDGPYAVYGYAGVGMVTDSSDDDAGSVDLYTWYTDSVSITSGKLSLAGGVAPKLVYKHKLHKEENTGRLFVYVEKPDGEQTIIDEVKAADVAEEAWQLRQVDMTPYVGERYVRVGFVYDNRESTADADINHWLVDQIRIADLQATDVEVAISKVPATVEKGQKGQLTVKLSNIGTEEISGMKLKLTVGDKVVANYQLAQKIASFDNANINYDFDTDLLAQSNTLPVKVEVTLNGDADETNNTAEASIALTDPDAETVIDLTLTKNEESADALSATLSWTSPEGAHAVTDDFESYEPWSISGVGNWTLFDADQGWTAGYFSGARYTHQQEPFAFIVFATDDYDGNDVSQVLPAHSGKQMMVAVPTYSAVGNHPRCDVDNWLISPELSGNAQTVKLWVNNYKASTMEYVEDYEVLASTTDTDVASFTIVGEARKAEGGQWTEVSAELPEGTKYIAIRHTTPVVWEDPVNLTGVQSAAFYFAIDDVTFEVTGDEVEMFRIYRDGKLIGETGNVTFTDTEVTEGDHTYQVTVVYANGIESAPVSVDTTLTGIAAVVNSGERFDVYTVSGVKVREGVTTLSGLSRGVYVINNKKVLVK